LSIISFCLVESFLLLLSQE